MRLQPGLGVVLFTIAFLSPLGALHADDRTKRLESVNDAIDLIAEQAIDELLPEHRDPELIETLCIRLADPNRALRSAAADALVRLDAFDSPVLTRLLGSNPGRARAAAADVLRRGKRLTIQELEILVRDTDARVRVTAARALARHRKRGSELLVKLLEDPEVAVANEAANGLGANRAAGEHAIDALTAALKRPDLAATSLRSLQRYGSAARRSLPAILSASAGIDSTSYLGPMGMGRLGMGFGMSMDDYLVDMRGLKPFGPADGRDAAAFILLLDHENVEVAILAADLLSTIALNDASARDALSAKVQSTLADYDIQSPTTRRLVVAETCAAGHWKATKDWETYFDSIAEISTVGKWWFYPDPGEAWTHVPDDAWPTIEKHLRSPIPEVARTFASGLRNNVQVPPDVVKLVEVAANAKLTTKSNPDRTPQVRGVSTYTSGNHWSIESDYDNLHAYGPAPENQRRNAVVVSWQPIQRDSLGTHVTVRGQLLHELDGKLLPVRWFQGVTVFVGKSGETDREGPDEDLQRESIINQPSGQFEATLNVRTLNFPKDQPCEIQVGLSLAKHSADSRGKVSWRSDQPLISAKLAVLPKAAEIPYEVRLIDEASAWPFEDPDPAPLIRAVNALSKLTKNEALARLDQYFELTDRYDDDRQILFWITRLLFEPPCLQDWPRAPWIAVHLTDKGSRNARSWRRNPLEVVEGIPFMMGTRIGLAGMEENPIRHLQSARRHGVMRDRPLEPKIDPISTAELLLKSKKFQQLKPHTRRQAERSVMRQSQAMLEDVVELKSVRRGSFAARHWETLKQAANSTGPFAWDAKEQRFVVAGSEEPVEEP